MKEFIIFSIRKYEILLNTKEKGEKNKIRKKSNKSLWLLSFVGIWKIKKNPWFINFIVDV